MMLSSRALLLAVVVALLCATVAAVPVSLRHGRGRSLIPQDEPTLLTSFLETSVSFDPATAAEHRKGAIGKLRAARVRRKKMVNVHGADPAPAAAKPTTDGTNFGLYDERQAKEEAKHMSDDLAKAMDAARAKSRGPRPPGAARAPFCSTFPWCKEVPRPPELADLPFPENEAVLKAELARLDPVAQLPVKLPELKKDPYRFGIVFQHIYDSNKHNEGLNNEMGADAAKPKT